MLALGLVGAAGVAFVSVSIDRARRDTPGPPAGAVDSPASPEPPLDLGSPDSPDGAQPTRDLLSLYDDDDDRSYEQAYEQTGADRLGRAEAALLIHYRYGPDHERRAEAMALLEADRRGNQATATATRARRVRGLALLTAGSLDEALTRLDGEDPRSQLYRAWVLLEQGEPERALTAAEAARAARPGDRAAVLATLQARFAIAPAEGVEAMRAAARETPDHAALQTVLAHAERATASDEGSRGSSERTRREADRAVASGRPREAMRLLDRAAIHDESSPRSAKPGAGFPSFDGAREHVVFGRVRSSDAVVPGDAETHGEFDEVDPFSDAAGLLRRTADEDEDRTGSAFWLATGRRAIVRDGLVRFSVVPGERPDLGLMFRVDATRGWDAVDGYELSFDRHQVRLLRWDRGVAKPVGDSVSLRGLSASTPVEVVVYLVGPQLIAAVYVGSGLELGATLTGRDTTYAGGQVGIRMGMAQLDGGLRLLSVMDTARATPPPDADDRGEPDRAPQHGRLYGPDRAWGATPFGAERFAYVPDDQLAQLPRSLRRKHSGATTRAGSPHAVLRLSTVEAEQLWRTGVEVSAIDGTAPWSVFHESYRTHRDQPPTPTRRGFALGDSYKNPAMVEDLLRAYSERYPDISELVELGRTHQDRPVWALKISDHPDRAEDEPSVLFTATHHSSELLSTEFGLDVVAGLLEGYGRDAQVTRWVDGMEIYCVPMVNPDGNAYFLDTSQWAFRKNGRDNDGDGVLDPFEGVDLNRNYPFGWGERGGDARATSHRYRGPAAASEPETQAMMTLADRQHFAASISFHTIGRAIFVPYTVDRERSPRPNIAHVVAQELVAAAPLQRNGLPYVVRPNGYPVAGSDQDWHMFAHGTVALLLEGAYHNPPLDLREVAVANTRPVWRALLDRVATGPRISGHVRDSGGAVVEASVTIDAIELVAGERWTARARDGRFDRLLARAGRYTVRAEAEGYGSASQEVRVGERPVEIDLVLARTEEPRP